MNSISPWRAVLLGLVVVNVPVFILLFGPMTFAWWLGGAPEAISPAEMKHLLVVFAPSFVVAWLWWSYSVPRWRVWAYQRVTNIKRLKSLAVAVGLTWPDGWVFERTEFKSQRLRELEADAISRHRGEGK